MEVDFIHVSDLRRAAKLTDKETLFIVMKHGRAVGIYIPEALIRKLIGEEDRNPIVRLVKEALSSVVYKHA